VIVGPNGAALINSIFARPGTRIGVLDNPYDDNETYPEVCRALGQRLLFLTGEVVDRDPTYIFNSSYRIPVEYLPAYLESLLA
jgi:hypothetical protein